MDTHRFESMVARLERESAEAPAHYQVKVALLALLGLLILLLVLGVAGSGLLLLAGAAIALLFNGASAWLLLLKLGKLLFLLAVPLWLLVQSSLRALFVRLPKPEGHEIHREDAPVLFAALDRMRQQMRGPRFHHVLLTDEMNAAVVQRPAFGLIGWPRNYLLLGLPLLESLSEAEALAVVAHEYGHLAGSHGRFAAFIYRLRLSWATIQAIAAQWQGWIGRLLQWPVRWYVPYFNAYTFVLARTNEYQADQASADLVGADTAASALKRVNIEGPRYQQFLGDTFARMTHDAQPPRDLAAQWSLAAATEVPAPRMQRWLSQAMHRRAHAMDTHPPLAERLRALGGGDAVLSEPPPLAGPRAAESWLGAAAPHWRQQLADHWYSQVREPWTQRHAELKRKRIDLDALLALPDLTNEQWLERIQLQQLLDTDFDAVGAYAAFNAANPGHALALYGEGAARLKADDEAGIALLEQVMALDASATAPACELIYGALQERGDARADGYLQRWQRRVELEEALAQQAQHLDPRHELVAPQLDPAQQATVQAILRSAGQGVKHVYLTRRVLPADPTHPSYLLVVELTWWARLRNQRDKVLQALADHEWPVPLLLVAGQGQHRALLPKARRVIGAQLQ